MSRPVLRSYAFGCVFLLAVGALAGASASQTTLDFDVPAKVAGDLDLRTTRLLVVFPIAMDDAPPGTALSLEDLDVTAFTNRTESYAIGQVKDVLGVMHPLASDETVSRSVEWSSLGLRSSQRPASVYIEAESIVVEGSGAGDLLSARRETYLSEIHRGNSEEARSFQDLQIARDEAVFLLDMQGGSIRADGLRRVAWFQTDVACAEPARECPRGGGRVSQRTEPQPGSFLIVQNNHYESIQTNGGTLIGTFAGASVLGSGPSVDLDLDGNIRLPMAHGFTTCHGCQLPDGRTLVSEGLLSLRSIQPAEGTGDRLVATVSGRPTAVRFDEEPIDPQSFLQVMPVSIAGVAAAAGLGILAKILLGALFTRRKRDPLAHPRRQSLYAYVCAHPGASFREVARQAGLAAGTARHHLTVLKRNGLIVEHAYRSSVRFFENHGKFAANWQEVVLRREPSLALLEDWIRANPGRPQKDLLDAMASANGWSRSTTQHRLGRLVRDNLVHATHSGRLLIYRPGPKPAPAMAKPLPALLRMSVPPSAAGT